MRSGLARLFRYRNKGRMRFGRKLVRLEMVRAQSEQEDDRDRDADQPQEDGTHALLLYIPAAAQSLAARIGSLTESVRAQVKYSRPS
jgi:hypothetical protein